MRRENVTKLLQDNGASPADIAALVGAFVQRPGYGERVGLSAIARDGQLVVDQVTVGSAPAADIAYVGSLPALVPALRARELAIPVVLLEADAEGGRIRTFSGSAGPSSTDRSIEGSTDHIHDAGSGGDAHADHAHPTDNVWQANADEVATAAAERVRRDAARLLVVTGDPHVTQLVVSQLPALPGVTVAPYAVETVAAGADEADVNGFLLDQTTAIVESARAAVIDDLATKDFERGALGVDAVVHAMQQAQVDTLIVALDPDTGETAGATGDLVALDDAPWVAASESDSLGVTVVGPQGAVSALVRAAVATDATVRFVAPGALPDGAGVAALLRWPADPTT